MRALVHRVREMVDCLGSVTVESYRPMIVNTFYLRGHDARLTIIAERESRITEHEQIELYDDKRNNAPRYRASDDQKWFGEICEQRVVDTNDGAETIVVRGMCGMAYRVAEALNAIHGNGVIVEPKP